MIYFSLKNVKNINFLIIFGIVFLVLFSTQIKNVDASATTTLRGKAWWQDNGYVYFNCLDDVMGDRLDEPGNLSGSGKYLPPDDKFHFFAEPCENSLHAVYIDNQGNLRGQAWNVSQGFISFEGTDDPPDGYGELSPNCEGKCNASNDCWACFREDQKKIYGWARVDTTKEWIRLDHASTTPIYLETCSATPVINKSPGVVAMGLEPGDFYGYAVSMSSANVMFFNCKNDSRNSGDTCYEDYKVYLETLTVGGMTAPDFTYTQACTGNSLGATLGWCVKSGQQTAYEIVVNKTNFGAEPTTENINNAFCATGKVNSSANQFLVHNGCSNTLEYGTNYYWWLRLYNGDTPTEWYQYYGNSSGDTDGNIDNNTNTFTTFKHRFPSPFFTWSPEEIFVGSSTVFTATSSIFYTTAQPITPQSCSGPNCRYFWETSDYKATLSSTNTITTDITFMIATNTTVSLELRDIDNYMCKRTSPILEINYDLPIWREIKAK